MLHERSSGITSFVKHPVFSTLKMHSALIFFFFSCHISLKIFLQKSYFQEIDIVSFVEHPVYSISKMYGVLILVFWFWFSTIYIYPKSMYKNHLFLKFQVLRKGSSFIASFVEQPVCSNFKTDSVLILVFYFDLLLLIQFACVKVKFSWTSRCPAKEAVILCLVCEAPCIYHFKM